MPRLIGVAVLPALLLATSPGVAGEHLGIDKVPAAVRATVERETKGGKLQSIETDHDDGVLIYEVEYTIDGKKWELDIASDGKLLEKHAD
jgi:uncharacterized protein YpmB